MAKSLRLRCIETWVFNGISSLYSANDIWTSNANDKLFEYCLGKVFRCARASEWRFIAQHGLQLTSWLLQFLPQPLMDSISIFAYQKQIDQVKMDGHGAMLCLGDFHEVRPYNFAEAPRTITAGKPWDGGFGHYLAAFTSGTLFWLPENFRTLCLRCIGFARPCQVHHMESWSIAEESQNLIFRAKQSSICSGRNVPLSVSFGLTWLYDRMFASFI